MSDEIKVEEKKFQNWIIFSIYMESLSLAMHLIKEGKNVIVAQVDDLKSVGVKEPEEKEIKRRRWSPGEGLFKKQKAEDLIKKMEKIENKDEYFLIFDFNSLYEYADKAVKMGFKYGIFPSKFDYKLENDRDFAKEFVQQYYPDLKVAEHQEFKTIEEGIDFIKNSEEFYALKGNDIGCQTVVPSTLNHDFAVEELVDALTAHKEDYQHQGFVLERQIRDGTEFCPQSVWYDGKPSCFSVDIENKAIGGGNIGQKYGCLENLIVSMPNDAEVVKKAFPEVVEKLAKKHPGLYYMDANLILKDGELYYLEFCSQRMGYDSIQAECEMAGSVSKYFEDLCNGKNPYERKFGVAVRGMNLHKDEEGMPKGDLQMRWLPEVEDHIWFYDCHKDVEKGKYVNGGYEAELLVVFGASSDDIEYSIIKCYEVIEGFSFDELYFRDYHDFINKEYYNNILGRYEAIEDIISSPAVEGESKSK